MQKSQPEIEQWPSSLMRTRSGNSRDNKKVSCETLSKVDWYSRRPYEAQLYYHSDYDEEENPASDAEDEREDKERVAEDGKEERGKAEKLESHVYGGVFSAEGHHFLACFPSKGAQGKPAIAISSPGRETKKTERVPPRTYPSPIPHSGSLLPHSGRLLPHSGPIKLHVGSHANTHVSNKVSGSSRGLSLIPANISGKSKSSGFGSTNEPSSPKVTCFGRVKIKQKYCKEMGRLADMAAVAPKEKAHKSIGDQMSKIKRRKDKAHAVEEEVASSAERHKVAVASARRNSRPEDGKRANKAFILSSSGATADLKKSPHGWDPPGEDVLRTDAASDSESKGQKGKWRFKEAGMRMKLRGGDKKKSCSPGVLDTHRSSSQADSLTRVESCANIDLNRFRSAADKPCEQQNRLSKSLASLSIDHESQNIAETDDTEFVPQVPPPNSLLLMRNSKNRGACAAIAASSICRRREAETDEEAVSVDRQMHSPSLKEKSLKQLPSSLLGVENLDESELATTVSGHEQAASFTETKLKKLHAVIPTECISLEVKTNLSVYSQASLQKTPPEATSLWQRRSVMKPCALHVGKVSTLPVKQPTTR